jgi:hypothetical protein
LIIEEAEKEEPAEPENEDEDETEKPKKDTHGMENKGDVNMHWFVNYVLTKRISNQNTAFVNFYVDFILGMGHRKTCVSFTLKQAVGIFKRFMLINEELYAKVGPRAPSMPQGTSLLKPYLQALGHFIGSLTLAKSRPLLSSELDMKHLLLVGFKDNKNRKLIVTFVCRILKEAQFS